MRCDFLKKLTDIDEQEKKSIFLACRYLNSLDFNKEVMAIANRLKIKIPQYKVISSEGEIRDKFYLTVAIAVENSGFRFTTNKSTIEAYRTMQKKKPIEYHIQIMVDIYTERNIGILKQLLGDYFFIVPEDYDDYDFHRDGPNFAVGPVTGKTKAIEMEKNKKFEEISQKAEKLQADLEQLTTERDQMVKEKRKFRQDKEKAEEQAKKDREEAKNYANKLKISDAENKELKKELEDVRKTMAKLLEERDRQCHDKEILQNQFETQARKYAYMEKIASLKKVLLLNLSPKEEGAFPYQYKSLSLSMDIEAWPEEKFTEVWYCEGGINPLILAAALDKIKAKYGLLDVLNFEQRSLANLDLEVLA